MPHVFRTGALVVATCCLLAATSGAPRHTQTSTTNPYRVTLGWEKLPDGRALGIMSGAFPDPDGRHLWMLDRCGGNQCAGTDLDPILKLDLDGNLVESFGAGLFAFPHGFFLDHDGFLWVTEGGAHGDARAELGESLGLGHQVVKLNQWGEVVMRLGEAGVWGDGPGHFNGPSGVAVARNGDIWITDGHRGGNNRLVKFTADGTFLLEIGGGVGSESREPARFSDPHDVKIDSRGRVYVADRGNSRIQVFDPDGNLLYIWTHYGKPSGLFIDRNDILYAADGLSGTPRTGPPDPWRSNFGWDKGIRIGDLKEEQAWVVHLVPQHDRDIGPGLEFIGVDFDGNIYGGEINRQRLLRYELLRPLNVRQRAATSASYLYVWAGDPDEKDSDFLAVIDAAPESDRFGEIVSTVPVGRSSGAHHSEHVMPFGNHLVVNGFPSGQSWIFDLADPFRPTIAATFEGAGPYTSPHSFDRTPAGNILATFQYTGGDTARPGGLAELDPMGRFLRGSDAADPDDPELRPYSLAIAPRLDRVVTTTSDMSLQHEGQSVQIWSLGELKLLHTIPLPPGPRGDEHLNPAEPRFLPDGRAIVNTFNCGMYLLSGIASDAPHAVFIGSLPREPGSEVGTSECSLPVLFDNYWVQTSDPMSAIVVFDIHDPRAPRRVDVLAFDPGARPHWISREPGTNRMVMTGAGPQLDGMVVLLEIDPLSGELSIVAEFGREGDIGVSMRRESWPHGASGPAIPHGAVFSRPAPRGR